MPPILCSKCKGCLALEGDSWCIGCTGWESLGRELTSSWDSAGARVLASDLVINCARQVKALRALSAGLARQPDSAGSRRAHTPARASDLGPPRELSRTPLTRHRELPPPPAPKVEVEETDEEEDSDGSEEEEEPAEERAPEATTTAPKSAARHSGSRHSSVISPQPSRASSAGLDRAPERHRREERRERSRRRERRREKPARGRRAGRKHLGLSRLADDPTIPVHRKASGSLLELTAHRGREALDPHN